MKSDINLEKLLGCVDVPAQWVGLREVYESNTPRMIRDGVPVSNHFSSAPSDLIKQNQLQNHLPFTLMKAPGLHTKGHTIHHMLKAEKNYLQEE